MKTALITGVTGQDGCYLAKNLLEKGYKVYGAVKHTTGIQNWRLDEMGITNDIEYVDVDIVDQANVRRMIDKTKPDGMPKKCFDIKRANKYGWKPKNDFDHAFKLTYDYFENNVIR